MGEVLERAHSVLSRIARLGRDFRVAPKFGNIDAFAAYGNPDNDSDLDELDGKFTVREILVRFLLLSAIVDQGPDIEGVRDLVIEATNRYYTSGIRVFHEPNRFFDRFDECIRIMDTIHEEIKLRRRDEWAEKNHTNPSRYMLYLDNASQTLGYAIARWGPALSLAQALTEHHPESSEPLVDFLRSKFESAELMTHGIKGDRLYGVGKAIGDKAAHLFGKWVVYSYPLLRSKTDKAWDPWSFEVPFDSNAGRVLYRSGLLLDWASRQQYVDAEVLQPGQGKKNTTYLRVTNMRGVGSAAAKEEPKLVVANRELCTEHLRTHKSSPTKIEVQRVPSSVSLVNRDFSPGEIDDGLIKLGTTWCFNTDAPLCGQCPINDLCAGIREPALIQEVRT